VDKALNHYINLMLRCGFLILLTIAAVGCKPLQNSASDSLAVTSGGCDKSVLLDMTPTNKVDFAKNWQLGIKNLRQVYLDQQKQFLFEKDVLKLKCIQIRYLIEAEPNKQSEIILKMRGSDGYIVEVGHSRITGEGYPSAVRASKEDLSFDSSKTFDCISLGCLKEAIKNVYYGTHGTGQSRFKNELDLKNNKLLARFILHITESMRFNSIFDEIHRGFSGKKHASLPHSAIIKEGTVEKPIWLLWNDLSSTGDPDISVAHIDTLKKKYDIEQKQILEQKNQQNKDNKSKSSFKDEGSSSDASGACLTLSEGENLPPEILDYFDFGTVEGGLNLAGVCSNRLPRADENSKKTTQNAVKDIKQSIDEMQRAQAAMDATPDSAVRAAQLERFNIARGKAKVAVSTTRGIFNKIKIVGGRIVPYAAAAAEVAGFALGIAEVVQTGKTGVDAAAIIMEGLGIAGGIVAVAACDNCTPDQKAAAFFKGFFGIDFTLKARCVPGFEAIGSNICRKIGCPPGYRDDGATCFSDAKIIGSANAECPWYDKCGLATARGCSSCPAGYWNDGCTCRINPSAKGKDIYWTWDSDSAIPE
jgi:hypothetical protein